MKILLLQIKNKRPHFLIFLFALIISGLIIQGKNYFLILLKKLILFNILRKKFNSNWESNPQVCKTLYLQVQVPGWFKISLLCFITQYFLIIAINCLILCCSALKLVHLFSINPHLGPLQISLGRMVIDIVKFFFIYSLVLFAFACGEYNKALIP